MLSKILISSENENGSCNVSTNFSSKEGKCIACDNKIKKVIVAIQYLYIIMYTTMRYSHNPFLYFITKSTLH